MMTADQLIATLKLQPHPEGGAFAETFRDAHSTAIYFLLRAGQRSHWHRVHGAAETWHFYAGAPLELSIAQQTFVLGLDFAAGQRPQAVVPPGAWQAARSLGDWTLVGCTVAPAFTFEKFELAPAGFSPPA